MNTYKITNITNLLGKRDRKSNTTISFDYVNKMTKKTINIKPNDSVYLSVPTLPLSVHRLRIKNLIIITEVDASELAKISKKTKPVRKTKPKAMKKPVVNVIEKTKTELVKTKTKSVKKGRPTKKV